MIFEWPLILSRGKASSYGLEFSKWFLNLGVPREWNNFFGQNQFLLCLKIWVFIYLERNLTETKKSVNVLYESIKVFVRFWISLTFWIWFFCISLSNLFSARQMLPATDSRLTLNFVYTMPKITQFKNYNWMNFKKFFYNFQLHRRKISNETQAPHIFFCIELLTRIPGQ